MSAFVIEAPGFMTTVQDLGRPGHAASGVSASGAADPIALTIGNRLVGNELHAAALEMTMVGGAFRFEDDRVVALAGADPGARLDGRPVAPWRAVAVAAGGILACTALTGGARSYLCIRGGISVPLVFGSASTHVMTSLGGFAGRAVRAGDRVGLGVAAPRAPAPGVLDPSSIPGYRRDDPFRVTPGPQKWFDDRATAAFHATEWRVTDACDRMGIRLAGERILPATPRELTTEGVPLGAIQIPPSGDPIVLFVEHQTTGGYPKIANVIAADLPRLGTLRPRDTLWFAPVSMTDARALLRAQWEALDALLN
jgi:antagonist of KipI